MVALLAFIVTLSILVLIHEWGHYIVARLCGVRVLAFSLGFGRVLARRVDRRGCEWRLSAVPFGGYVMMLEKDTLEKASEMGIRLTEREAASQSFDSKRLWQRFAVVFAGPFMNFVLAAVIYAGIAMAGTYEPSTRLAEPAPATQAAEAGVREGWRVTSVNGSAVETFNALRLQIVGYQGERDVRIAFVDDAGAPHEADFDLSGLSGEMNQGDAAELLGLAPWTGAVVVGQVQEKSPAEAAGMKPGDTILALNGAPVRNAADFIGQVRASAGKGVVIDVRRADGSTAAIDVVPETQTVEDGSRAGRIGAVLGAMPDFVLTREGPLGAIAVGVEKTWEMVVVTGRVLKNIVVGTASTDNISGPLMIGDVAGQAVQFGLLSYLLFLAMISVNLGLLNLIPIPLLDGGHLFFFTLEALTGRKPGPKTLAVSQKIGIAFVLLLFALGMSNDLIRILG